MIFNEQEVIECGRWIVKLSATSLRNRSHMVFCSKVLPKAQVQLMVPPLYVVLWCVRAILFGKNFRRSHQLVLLVLHSHGWCVGQDCIISHVRWGDTDRTAAIFQLDLSGKLFGKPVILQDDLDEGGKRHTLQTIVRATDSPAMFVEGWYSQWAV